MATDEPGLSLTLRGLSPWREASQILAAAQRDAVPVKLIGSAGVRWHCPYHGDLFERLEREPARDLDLVVEKPAVRELASILEQLSLVQDRRIGQASDGQQLLFQSADLSLNVDVYVDQLQYCHTIFFRGVLGHAHPTVPLAELLLTKLQIVELTDKDVKDVAILLLEHAVSAPNQALDWEIVDVGRFVAPLRKSWGFWYTVDRNLGWISDHVAGMSQLTEKQRETIRTRLQSLRSFASESPKSTSWKIRSKIGTRRLWYQDVEEKD